MTKKIPLTQGKFAIVDDGDYEELSQYKWYFHAEGKTGYAIRQIRLSSGKWSSVKMHRQIMEATPENEIDHIDGNGINNRRSNLRFCSRSENMRNISVRKDSLTGYKCVARSGRKWYAYISVNGRRQYLGIFPNRELAALAYNQAAIKYRGDFARLNDIREA